MVFYAQRLFFNYMDENYYLQSFCRSSVVFLLSFFCLQILLLKFSISQCFQSSFFQSKLFVFKSSFFNRSFLCFDQVFYFFNIFNQAYMIKLLILIFYFFVCSCLNSFHKVFQKWNRILYFRNGNLWMHTQITMEFTFLNRGEIKKKL